MCANRESEIKGEADFGKLVSCCRGKDVERLSIGPAYIVFGDEIQCRARRAVHRTKTAIPHAHVNAVFDSA